VALIPPNCVLTHIAPYLFTPIGHARNEAFLLGVMSSLVYDWYARKFIETAADFHLVSAFPVPSGVEKPLENTITTISGRLAAVDERYQDWAHEVGVEIRSIKTDAEKYRLIAELDGLVALAYGLNADDLRHIYGSFHRGWTDPVRLEIAVSTMENWG
jgi:hypothetical protein